MKVSKSMVLVYVLFVIFSLYSPSFAEEKSGIISEFYLTSLNYTGSLNKDDGWTSVFYSSFPLETGKIFEFGLGHADITYSDGTPDLKQEEITLTYSDSGNMLKNTTTRFGTHFILNKEGVESGGKAIFVDLTCYRPFPENYGLELAFSNYDGNSIGNIVQIGPHYGKWLGHADKNNTLYLETKAVFIKSFRGVRVDLSDDVWSSVELSLSGKINRWDHKTTIWGGERVFMVDNGGFVMYNLADRYIGGILATVGYRFSKDFRLGIGAAWQEYKEAISNEQVDSTTANLVLTWYF